MRWWFRRKQEQPAGLRLSFEYVPGQPLSCIAEWPADVDDEGKAAIVSDFSQILTLVGTGNLLSASQQAIAVAGQENNSPKIARDILQQSNAMLAQYHGTKRQAQSEGPLVPATKCFPSRRNEGDMDDD